jgi:hypothetical protein
MKYFLIIVFVLFAITLMANEPPADAADNNTGATAGMDEAVMQAHRFFAADYFNKCWDYIDKPERTPEDDLMMIHAAHASRAHWEAVGNVSNHAVGEWQISHVYAILNNPQEALYYGNACLNVCVNNQIDGFNLGFAYEALARAEMLLDNQQKVDEYLELGTQAAQKVEEIEDQEYLLNELNSIKK